MIGTSGMASADVANAPRYRTSLRNANINYRNGWFFVTVQVRHNKSIFGAVVGEEVALNGFGRSVWDYWLGLPAKYPELEVFASVLMPNHFHALVRIRYRETNKPHHLGFLMSRFKGGTSYLYGKARAAGEVEDIGDHLWQIDYWDNLVTSEVEFQAIAKYIRENPKNWSRDRYGACTRYAFGDLELLNAPRIAFVASQGFYASELRPRKIWSRTAKAARYDGDGDGDVERDGEGANRAARYDGDGDGDGEGANRAARYDGDGDGEGEGANRAARYDGDEEGAATSGRAALAVHKSPVLISTFTSAQEREALRRALAKGKRVIQVMPQGLPREDEMPPELLAACREGRALLLSPQPSGSRLNKKIATWCNEYVLKHVDAIWVGDISPNGMLAALIGGLHRNANLH